MQLLAWKRTSSQFAGLPEHGGKYTALSYSWAMNDSGDAPLVFLSHMVIEDGLS